jgi:hypothetical protein
MFLYIVVDHDYKPVAVFNTEDQAISYINEISYEEVRDNHSYYEVPHNGEKRSDGGTVS